MKVTPEIIARIIYLTSNLRFFEKEYDKEPNWDNRNLVIKYQTVLDDYLKELDVSEFISEQDLCDSITLVRYPYKSAI